MRRAKSVWLSLALLMGVLFSMSALGQEAAAYVGNGQCKVCHNSKEGGEIWNKWKAEEHAKAYQFLAGDKAKRPPRRRNSTSRPPRLRNVSSVT